MKHKYGDVLKYERNKGYRLLYLPGYDKSNNPHSAYPEHRYVMEQYLKRRLNSNEIVHHINGNTYDNRIENLTIISNVHHKIIHKRRKYYDVRVPTRKFDISKAFRDITLEQIYDIFKFKK